MDVSGVIGFARQGSRIVRRRLRTAYAVSALGLAVLVSASLQAGAQDRPDGDVGAIERQAEEDRERAADLRERASELAEEIRAMKGESVTLARRAQDLEQELSDLEATFATLQEREAEKLAALDRQRARLSKTLGALQRIAMRPPEALVFGSASPLEVVRGAMLLGEAVPAIEGRARDLRGELHDLRRLRADMAAQKERMAETRARLEDQRGELLALVARKQDLRRELRGRSRVAAERAAALATKAETMRELMIQLREEPPASVPQPTRKPRVLRSDQSQEAEGGQNADADDAGTQAASQRADENQRTRQIARLTRPEDIREFPEQRSSLRLPVSGRIVTRYGEKMRRDGVATSAKGIVIATRDSAQVVAPYDGKVAYAGPFKGYGRILIIEHGERYHTLLAGIERIDAMVGQWVLAGEPLGLMAGPSTGSPELYMELRRTGRPINPVPWLANIGEKVKG